MAERRSYDGEWHADPYPGDRATNGAGGPYRARHSLPADPSAGSHPSDGSAVTPQRSADLPVFRAPSAGRSQATGPVGPPQPPGPVGPPQPLGGYDTRGVDSGHAGYQPQAGYPADPDHADQYQDGYGARYDDRYDAAYAGHDDRYDAAYAGHDDRYDAAYADDDRLLGPGSELYGQDEADVPTGRGGRRRRDGRRSLIALACLVAILGALVGGGWYGYGEIRERFLTPDYAGEGTGTATVQITSGQTITQIGRTLTDAGVIKSPKAFVKAAEQDQRASGLQPGTYQLRKEMSGVAALALLLDPVSRLVKKFTVPEGLTLAETLDTIAKGTGISIDELHAASRDLDQLGVPDWVKPIEPVQAPKVTLPPEIVLEGLLFPDTYEVEPDDTALTVLAAMVNRSLDVFTELDMVNRAQTLGLTPYQILIIASVVEEEVKLPEDYPKAARVIYNRIDQGTLWGMDSTVNYVSKANTLNPTVSQLDAESPYNTRKYRGYPPTPISGPGKAAIEGALSPADGKWFYFVTVDKKGTTRFAVTGSEHEVNIAEARRNGVLK